MGQSEGAIDVDGMQHTRPSVPCAAIALLCDSTTQARRNATLRKTRKQRRVKERKNE